MDGCSVDVLVTSPQIHSSVMPPSSERSVALHYRTVYPAPGQKGASSVCGKAQSALSPTPCSSRSTARIPGEGASPSWPGWWPEGRGYVPEEWSTSFRDTDLPFVLPGTDLEEVEPCKLDHLICVSISGESSCPPIMMGTAEGRS